MVSVPLDLDVPAPTSTLTGFRQLHQNDLTTTTPGRCRYLLFCVAAAAGDAGPGFLRLRCRIVAVPRGAAITGVRGRTFFFNNFIPLAFLTPSRQVRRLPSSAFPIRRQPARPDGVINGTLKAIGLGSVQPDWLGRPVPCLAVCDGGAALVEHGRVLRRAVLGGHGVYSEGLRPGRAAAMAPAAPPPSSRSPFRCSGTPCSRDGCTWGSCAGAEAFAAVYIHDRGSWWPRLLHPRLLSATSVPSAFRDANAAYATTRSVSRG